MTASWRNVMRDGLEVLEVETAAARAAIAVQGAQVLSFAPRGERDWLWVSERARWAPGTALRGGIPICFPWFGPHPTDKTLPAHGFARTRDWRLVAVREVDGGMRIELGLTADERTLALFPHRFEARLVVTVARELTLAFEVSNPGGAPLPFEVALHGYLAVADLDAVTIEGLAGRAFADKVAGGAEGRQGPAPLRVAGEVDRVYENDGPVTLVDPIGRRRLRVETSGAGSTVVWNPAPAKTAALDDMAPDGFRRFVCIEPGAIGPRRVTLAPGGWHRLTVRYGVAAAAAPAPPGRR